MNTDLTSLRLMLATVDAGSITHGARRVHLSLAAASKRITDLEAEVGATLLVRQARGVVATPAGETFCAYARGVLAASMRVVDELRVAGGEAPARVTIFANASAIAQFLPADLRAFLQRWPDTLIELEEHASSTVVDAVLQDRADLGVIEASAADAGIGQCPYRSDRLVLVVPPNHRLARRRRIAFSDVLGESFVGLYRATAVMRRLEAAASTDAKPLRLRMQVGSFDSVCRMVAADIGIGVVPELAAAPHAAAGSLRCVALQDAWAQRRLLLVWPRHRRLAPTALRLLRHLGEPVSGDTAFDVVEG